MSSIKTSFFRESAEDEFQVMTELPGGKYWEPSEQVRAHASNVPASNVPSEQGFAVLDLLSIVRGGKSHVYSLNELRLHLIEVLRINQVEREEIEEEPELQPVLTYCSEEETHGRLAEEK
ncbi:hypothetical protein AAFF_G00415970 [Aldrovandia affinis]|uniref:Uncharacterized protein n=1 Tax=Aldrovandia affinis TaxID=143900 RepID=A0AAD7VYY3_9TELE|nr:hypothetical protein AAFF_G00415970 [Aldrovandia affinis]